jgi:Zn-dependent protease
MRIATYTMPVVLGSEWGHNLAHAAAANWVGKPMDAIRITWGMPLCVYYDINDDSVTPQQHILRALGGPISSFTLLVISSAVRRITPKASLSREVADVSYATNAFLSMVSLLPIPGIDGGPILKWSLVERGRTVEEADQVIRKVDGGLGIALSFLSAATISRGKRVIGLLSAMLAVMSFGVAFGWIREQD